MDESIFDKLEGLFKGTVHKEIQDMEATVFHLETDKKRLEGEMEQLRSMNKSCQVVIDQLQQGIFQCLHPVPPPSFSFFFLFIDEYVWW